jgi:flagellar assembly factor FliW
MSSTLTFESSRFGALQVAEEDVIEFPHGLIGLGGRRYAIVTRDGGAFAWLHSVEDPALALPVTNPWAFFADYAVDISDEESARLGISDPAAVGVWVTVRAGATPAEFSANLRAPILVANGRGHQVINEAPHAPVRAPLFPEASPAERAA